MNGGSSIWSDIRNNFLRSGSMVNQLIIINLAVYLLVKVGEMMGFFYNISIDVVDGFISNWLGVHSKFSQLIFKPWGLITYMFTHHGFFHILFNMLWFYWMGIILDQYVGNRKILPIYIMGGLAGAVLFILAYNIFPVFHGIDGLAIGASAGVTATVIATATLLPDFVIRLFLIGNVKLKYLAFVFIFLDVLLIPYGNAGGHIAHLGGALYGFLFIRQLQKGNDWSATFNKIVDGFAGFLSNKRKPKVVYKSRSGRKKPATKTSSDQEKIDTILDKISKSGYDSLTTEEKELLFRASKEK